MMFSSADQQSDARATHATSMSEPSLIAGYTPLCDNLSAVTHAFSRVREEQVQLVSCAKVTLREHTYILKT